MDWGCASRQHTSTPNKAWKIKIPSTQLLCVDEESGGNAMDLVDNTTERLERTCFLLRRLNKWIGAVESFIMTLVTVYHSWEKFNCDDELQKLQLLLYLLLLKHVTMAKSFVLNLSYACNLQQDSINSSCLARDKQVISQLQSILAEKKSKKVDACRWSICEFGNLQLEFTQDTKCTYTFMIHWIEQSMSHSSLVIGKLLPE